jgi:hypothetical protein
MAGASEALAALEASWPRPRSERKRRILAAGVGLERARHARASGSLGELVLHLRDDARRDGEALPERRPDDDQIVAQLERVVGGEHRHREVRAGHPR